MSPATIDTADVEIDGLHLHYLHAGSGPLLVVLLHGWPQTSMEWRSVMPQLAETHTVVAPDLRGYGLTDAPQHGYDKRTMAADVRGLVRALGHDRVALVGHDRGARVAHRYALDHPDEIERLALLDIIPTREVVRRFDATLAAGFWHWMFHMQPDLPELLVGDRVREYLAFFFERWAWRRAAIEPAAVDAYVRAFTRPGRLRAGFEDYRATLTADLPADDGDFAAGRRLAMPVLALWGDHGLIAGLPVLDIWREYADDVRGRVVPECGHFLPEERPEAVAADLRTFLAAEPGR